MVEKYLLFSLEDEESRKLGEVISNPTCKKIVNLLAEKELSQKDIAQELKIPLNTVEYNIKKLLEAGIIEKTKNFFWSVKGKKIETYKVANKLIVISPKKSNVYNKLKGIIPVLLICAILTLIIAGYYGLTNTSEIDKLASFEKSGDLSYSDVGEDSGVSLSSNLEDSGLDTNSKEKGVALGTALASANFWLWFLAGAIIALIAFAVWNWKKL